MRCSVSEMTFCAIDSSRGESTREILGGASGITAIKDLQVEQGAISPPSTFLRIASPRSRRYSQRLERKDKLTTVLACSYGLAIRQKTEKHTPSLRNSTSFLTLE